MCDTLNQFLRRPAPDNSYCSICMRCFATAGSGRTEAELETAESKHVCKPEALRSKARLPSDHY
jgi:hypothetical protein